MSLRRSARNASSNTHSEPSAISQTKAPRARKVKAKSSQPTSTSEGNVAKPAAKVKKAAPAKTKAPKRVPLASRETTKDIEDQSVAKVVSAPVEDESKENAPLQGFVDDPDVTHDIDEEEVDHKTVEMVSNWQAKTLGTPPQPSRRLPFSSSLPPSSPLPPMSEISAFSPPSPQQERNLVDPDMSYDSVASDDFGFFAAQRKIHAKRDREHNLNTASQMTQPRGRVSDAFDTSMEASFSGRPAFATPHVRRQARSTPSSQHGEDTTLELEEGSSPAVGTKRLRRSRGSSQAKAPSVHEDDEPEEKVMAPRRRPKRAVLPPIVPLGKGKGKASTSTSRKTSDSRKASDSRKVSGSRKTSGSSAGGKSRGKRAVKGAGDEEEIDLGGVGSDDSDDDTGNDKAKKQRLAEFKSLDDYELEVEDVIVF